MDTAGTGPPSHGSPTLRSLPADCCSTGSRRHPGWDVAASILSLQGLVESWRWEAHGLWRWGGPRATGMWTVAPGNSLAHSHWHWVPRRPPGTRVRSRSFDRARQFASLDPAPSRPYRLPGHMTAGRCGQQANRPQVAARSIGQSSVGQQGQKTSELWPAGALLEGKKPISGWVAPGVPLQAATSLALARVCLNLCRTTPAGASGATQETDLGLLLAAKVLLFAEARLCRSGRGSVVPRDSEVSTWLAYWVPDLVG